MSNPRWPQIVEQVGAVDGVWVSRIARLPDGSQIIGGHAVPILGYDPQNYQVITWGALQQMTGHFLDLYFEEAYAVVTDSFLDKTGHDPQGLDLQQLKQLVDK